MKQLSKSSGARWILTKRAKRIFYPVFVLAIVNFTSFMIISANLGGDGLNGHVTDGHYFLGSHGRYTEVSKAVWTYSYWHSISVFVTHLSVFIVVAILWKTGDMRIEKK